MLLRAEDVRAGEADGDLRAGLRKLGEGENTIDAVASHPFRRALGLHLDLRHQRVLEADPRADEARGFRIARQDRAAAADDHDVELRASRLARRATLDLREVDHGDGGAVDGCVALRPDARRLMPSSDGKGASVHGRPELADLKRVRTEDVSQVIAANAAKEGTVRRAHRAASAIDDRQRGRPLHACREGAQCGAAFCAIRRSDIGIAVRRLEDEIGLAQHRIVIVRPDSSEAQGPALRPENEFGALRCAMVQEQQDGGGEGDDDKQDETPAQAHHRPAQSRHAKCRTRHAALRSRRRIGPGRFFFVQLEARRH